MRISDWSSDVCSSDLLHAVRRYQWQSGQLRRRIAQRARVTHHHGVSFAALDSLVDRLAADDRGDEPLHVGLGEAVTRRSLRFDLDIPVAPAGDALGPRGADARNGARDLFDMATDLRQHLQLRPQDLDPDPALEIGRTS